MLPGWIGQWKEMVRTQGRIGRPRQVYDGPTSREFPPIEAENAEEAARKFIVDHASQYPNELGEWDLSVTSPTADKFRAKVIGTKLIENGNAEEVTIKTWHVT